MVNRSDGLAYQIGQGLSALDMEARRDKLDGFSVVSGLAVTTDGTDLTLDVGQSAGGGTATVGYSSGSVDTVSLGSATTVTLTTADPDNPRKDVVYLDTGGTVQVETGVAEPAAPSGNTRFDTYQPEPPLPSTTGTVLAEVYVAAGASAIESADIRDRRQPSDLVADEVVAQSVDAGSVNTDTASVTNEPTAANEVSRREELPQAGTVESSSLGPSVDDTLDTFASDITSTTFAEAFASAPKVVATVNFDVSTASTGWFPRVGNVSATGFDCSFINYSTSDLKTETVGSDWIATRGRP